MFKKSVLYQRDVGLDWKSEQSSSQVYLARHVFTQCCTESPGHKRAPTNSADVLTQEVLTVSYSQVPTWTLRLKTWRRKQETHAGKWGPWNRKSNQMRSVSAKYVPILSPLLFGGSFFAPLLLIKNISDPTLMGAYHLVPEHFNFSNIASFPISCDIPDVWGLTKKSSFSHIKNSLWVYNKHCDVGKLFPLHEL